MCVRITKSRRFAKATRKNGRIVGGINRWRSSGEREATAAAANENRNSVPGFRNQEDDEQN